MAWTKLRITQITDQENIVSIVAEWGPPKNTGSPAPSSPVPEQPAFHYRQDRVDVASPAARSDFVGNARQALLRWQESQTPKRLEKELLAELNS